MDRLMTPALSVNAAPRLASTSGVPAASMLDTVSEKKSMNVVLAFSNADVHREEKEEFHHKDTKTPRREEKEFIHR